MSHTKAFPAFLGIGAQKCATTWIAHALGDHPDLYVPPAKELDFWSHYFHYGFSWYLHTFAEATATRFGEVSPSYLVSGDAPARIAKHAPETKLILALRDPVERAYSNHLHQIRKGDYKEADTSFDAGLNDNPMYLGQSRYGEHLARWRDYFPAEQILVLFQEEIGADAAAEATRLYRFLGVNPEFQSDGVRERQHENITYRNAALGRGLRMVSRQARQAGMGNVIRALKNAPGIGALYQANRRDLRLEITKPSGQTKQRLSDELADDMALLCDLLGRDHLPWPTWHRVQSAAKKPELVPA